MSFPAEKPFNPPTSVVPRLDASSGNPKAFQDPKSVASLGLQIQAMTDQAGADTLYDAPPPQRDSKKDGFQNFISHIESHIDPRGNSLLLSRSLSYTNEGVQKNASPAFYKPWITQTEACRNEGFLDAPSHNLLLYVLLAAGAGLLICSFAKK